MNKHENKNKDGGENKDKRKNKDNKQVDKEASRPISPGSSSPEVRLVDPESPDSSFPDRDTHERILHRLDTARWVIWGGLAFILVISIATLLISGRCSSEDGIGGNTIFMTAISAVASIVTLALGYIAGSNIER